MANSDLNQKYTINQYCTMQEVSKGIGTNLIDPFWSQIIEFREKFSRALPLRDTNGAYYTLTHIDPVDKKEYAFNNHANRLSSLFNNLIDNSIAKKTLISEMLKSILKSIAALNSIDASEITLTNIISGVEVGEEYNILVRYKKALEHFARNHNNEISEEFLADYYAILRGEDELSCFYRLNDNETVASKSLVGRNYDNGVPARFIEPMMAQLISFLTNRNYPTVVKVSVTFYMFNYIKPFAEYNEELAAIVAKSIIAKENLEFASPYIPLESFLLNFKFYNEISKEVQKTHDFTYAFLCGFNSIEQSLISILDRIVQVNGHAVDTTIKLGDSAEEFKKEFGVNLGNEVIEEIKVSQKAVIETPKVEKRKEQVVKEKSNETESSEKDLKALEEEMLESNPYIKKGQAHFYVHHSTKGRFYTIQQYKKFIGCVYETARTSMDNLAMQGYYRRENIKNKFVYTPIDKE